MNKKIKKEARKDSNNCRLEEFNENPNDPKQKRFRKAVKTMRSKFTPRFVQMKDLKGMYVKLEERAEKLPPT